MSKKAAAPAAASKIEAAPLTLVVMAAGMGSRYGGLKQIDPLGPAGQVMLDYSVYDALKAGFRRVVFVIKPEMETLFKEKIGDRLEKHVEVRYAFQTLDAHLPKGFKLPCGREKPWGTGHAVLCAKQWLKGPFAVINADDYYGPAAFSLLADFFQKRKAAKLPQYALVGYRLINTLTENGSVARGVCTLAPRGMLATVTERTRIEKRGAGAAFTEDGGATWQSLPTDRFVSMNFWGLDENFLPSLEQGFHGFLQTLQTLPEEQSKKVEYYLPAAVSSLVEAGQAKVKLLKTPDRWYGVTYREDKEAVQQALLDMQRNKVYPKAMLGLGSKAIGKDQEKS